MYSLCRLGVILSFGRSFIFVVLFLGCSTNNQLILDERKKGPRAQEVVLNKRVKTRLDNILGLILRNKNPTMVCMEIGRLKADYKSLKEMSNFEGSNLLYHWDLIEYCMANTLLAKNYNPRRLRAQRRLVGFKSKMFR